MFFLYIKKNYGISQLFFHVIVLFKKKKKPAIDGISCLPDFGN